jgi:hypothetical protein
MRRCISTAMPIAIFTFAGALGCARTHDEATVRYECGPIPARELQILLAQGQIKDQVQDIVDGRQPGPAWVRNWGGTYTTIPPESRELRCGNESYPLIEIGPSKALWMNLAVGASEREVGTIIDGSDREVRIQWREERRDLPDRLQFVWWKGIPYVVTRKQIVDMLNDYNVYGQAEVEWYQKVDHVHRSKSFTDLPPEFAAAVHDTPIKLKIGELNPRAITQTYADRRSVPIELRSGIADGVYVGMDLPCTLLAADASPKLRSADKPTKDAEWPTLRIVIDHAEEHRSTGTLWITATADQSPTLPQAGDRLKTFQKRQVRPD